MIDDMTAPHAAGVDLLRLTRTIVAAYVRNNPVPAADVPAAIRSIYASVAALASGAPVEQTVPKPAVSIKKSLTAEYIICLEDGMKLKTLKRHLRQKYNLTPDQYRTKWGLPCDYPMVAPSYAAQRSTLAKKIGLGRTRPKAKRRKRS